jgi:hypothetical protein
MKKLLEFLFGKKTQSDTSLPKISEVLSEKQESDARTFYNRHKPRIDMLIKHIDKAYAPSQSEDKNNPMIWKTEYWKWFLSAK